MKQIFAIGVLAAYLPLIGLAQSQTPGIDYDSIHAAEAKANKQLDEAAKIAEAEKQKQQQQPQPNAGAQARVDPRSEREELLKERKHAIHHLEVAQMILNARSYAARTDAYCRDRVGSSGTLMMALSNGLSGDELEAFYKILLRAEPTTREGEEERQRKLEAVGDLVMHYEETVRECQGMILNGFQRLPSEAQLGEEVRTEKANIKDIDRLLGGR